MESSSFVNSDSREIRHVAVFVDVMGHPTIPTLSVEAYEGQDMMPHIRDLTFPDDVPKQLIPNNLRNAVKKADLHEPTINSVI